jgi:hypothetical protein
MFKSDRFIGEYDYFRTSEVRKYREVPRSREKYQEVQSTKKQKNEDSFQKFQLRFSRPIRFMNAKISSQMIRVVQHDRHDSSESL